MKPRSRGKHKGRTEGGTYFALPHAVWKSSAYAHLSAHAVKLLCDIGAQYNGYNNGDLCAAWRVMQPLGWRSRDTLFKALMELLQLGLIEKTRQGGMHQCNLYALTWHAIDECKDKLDVPATRTPSGLWRSPSRSENRSANTPSVSIKHAGRVNERQAA